MRIIQAKHSLYDDIKFDSKFERDVYILLRTFFPKETIIPQYKIEIKPATLNFPRRYWRVDFAIRPNKNYYWVPTLNIEVKGVISREYLMMLEYLEYFNRAEYSILKTISNTKKAPKMLQVYTPDEFRRIMTMILENKPCL